VLQELTIHFLRKFLMRKSQKLFFLLVSSFLFLNANKDKYPDFIDQEYSHDIPDVAKMLDDVESVTSDPCDKNTHTYLLRSIVKGNIEIVTKLLDYFKKYKKPIDVHNVRDQAGRNCLHLAVKYQHLDIVEFLLKNYDGAAFVATRDSLGQTALHYAITEWLPDCEIHYRSKRKCDTMVRIINTLIDYGADVNAQSIYGNTVLHVAAEYGNVCMYDLLCRYDICKNNDKLAKVKNFAGVMHWERSFIDDNRKKKLSVQDCLLDLQQTNLTTGLKAIRFIITKK